MNQHFLVLFYGSVNELQRQLSCMSCFFLGGVLGGRGGGWLRQDEAARKIYGISLVSGRAEAASRWAGRGEEGDAGWDVAAAIS